MRLFQGGPATADVAVDLTTLALGAQAGVPYGSDALMARVRPLAHRYCRARLASYPGGPHLADDVAQEVCIAVLSALSRYHDTGRPFEAFVHGICARKVADAQRAHGRAPLVTDEMPDEVDDAPTPEDRLVFDEEVQQASDMLDDLPDQLRDVMIWRVAMGMSADETGRALGMTAGAVRVAQHRALKLLRKRADNGGGRHG